MRKRCMTFSLIFTLLGVSAIVSGAETGRDLWMSGFAKFKEGAEAEKGGNELLALRLYQEAAQDLEKAQDKFPDWQPEVVSFRLQACTAKIASLNTKVRENEENMSVDDLQTLVATLRAQKNSFEEKFHQAQEELLKAQSTPAAPADMQEKLAALEAENKTLMAQLESAGGGRKEKTLAAKIDELEAQVDDLEASVEAGEDALKAANREIAKSEKLKEEIGGLKDIAVELEKSLAQMSEERETLRQELDKLLAERKAMAGEVDKLAGQLKALEKTSEKLRDQNEDLRNQLK